MESSVHWEFLWLCILLVGNGVEGEASHQTCRSLRSFPGDQLYKTAYHFQPPKNWMNDPNGPMFYLGVYHLFYQYNPYGAEWGNMVWAHSISYDLVNWIHLDHAIYPTGPFDINGCWSGSTTILPGGKPVILYTGIDAKNHQVQNLAEPRNLTDPLLRERVKSPHNPLMTPGDDIDPKFYRDPATAWQGPDNIWHVIVGSQIKGQGAAILYRSKDFVNWTRSKHPLHSSANTNMLGCPDFYPLDTKSSEGKHVLKASFNSHDYYILGDYIARTDKFSVTTDFTSDLQYDYGKFYASKTFLDSSTKRRILWVWVKESDSESDDNSKGWSGLQSIPRNVVLGKTGRQLVQWPIKEIENLRTRNVSFQNKKLKIGSLLEVSGITGSQADVEVSFDLVNLKEAELMDPIWVDPQLLCSQKKASAQGKLGPFGFDQSRSSLREGLDKTTYGAFVDIDPLQENISLRSLIDHSIVESFGGGGRTCITARVYPKFAYDKEAHLYVFNNGTQTVRISRLNAWSMRNAQIVPVKTRREPKLHKR
ncbi:Beta-fructofuranosidase, insoluble isoenzyme like [Quillaja saponaria]|uniref:Beta-fructofuranosidase, insoluble isoenzyme like n=1 Tax=Quillaja saponaria TaxID=32244 RepID=A0AAD7PTD3_QUISA|nr:Beta-fructofuranosidase, insoluble isoenzyme like [Quillaja saponaria]